MLTAEQKSGIDAILDAANLKRDDDITNDDNADRAIRIVKDVYDTLGLKSAAATLLDSRVEELIFVDWIAVAPLDLCDFLVGEIERLSPAGLADFYSFFIELACESEVESAERVYPFAIAAALQIIETLEQKLAETENEARHLCTVLRAAHCGTQFNDEGYKTEVEKENLAVVARLLERLLEKD